MICLNLVGIGKFLLHHWMFSLLGLVLFAVFGPMLVIRTWINIRYIAWRMFGGIGKVKDRAHARTLWEAFDLLDPQPLEISKTCNYAMSLPSIPVEQHSIPLVLEEVLRLHPMPLTGKTDASETTLQPVQVVYRKIFLTNPRRVKRGCHGCYSLAKAAFLASTYGGDPKCGGGIKHYWPSLFHAGRQAFHLHRILKSKKPLNAFAYAWGKDGHSSMVYDESFQKPEESRAHLTVFLGEEKVIRRYLAWLERKSERKSIIKPVQIQFAEAA